MRRPALIAVLAAAAFVACGSDETPTAANPSPTPTPAPAPTPTPSPAGFSCPLPASSNPSLNCGKGTARLTEVNLAIDNVMARHPEIFNFSDVTGGNPKVVNPSKYYTELKNELGALGVCTLVQLEEISVKSTNNFSEDWIVLTSGNYVRRRYQGTCTPAWW